MKKVLFFLAALVAAMSLNAADRYYNCGITSVEFSDQSYSDKHIFVLTLKHTAKNKNEYNIDKTYDATVKLYLTSEDGTLEGNYTTEGFVSIGSTYDKDYINPNSTEVKVTGYDARRPHPNYISTFVINKVGENQYSVGECALYVTDKQMNPTNMWCYYYSFDVNEIDKEGIGQTPFVFGVDTEFHTEYIDYDMTVKGVSVFQQNSDYNATRYFLVLTCEGTNRTNSVKHDYEVALAIYPTSESIVGTFATQGSTSILMAMDSYVQDLDKNKKRYLANDSLSTIQIKDKGDKQYSFYGGTLICADVDANYLEVYGKRRIETAHYYHFSDNGGAGIPFTFDETNKTIYITASSLTPDTWSEGLELIVSGTGDGSNFTLDIFIEGETLAGTHKLSSDLSAWTTVERGSLDSEITDSNANIVTITHKSGTTYTISATLECKNGYTYFLNEFDFQYGTATSIDAFVGDQPLRKVMMNGVLYLEKNGKLYNLQGAAVK